ncbi:MAG: chorismate synthase [Clostridia bacterium]|nr:chorismate synthase [Clostridia bacterium]
MSTTYGKNIHISIYGGSHDSEIGIRATGLPRGFRFDPSELSAFLKRRAPGQNSLSTPRKEADIPEFLSGVEDDFRLTGDELHAVIRNTNQRSSDYSNLSFVPRPSHADFAARMKYGEGVDLRGGGHFSGRLTAPLCIVGGICLQYLAQRGIRIGAHLASVGGICDRLFDPVAVGGSDFEYLQLHADFPVLDEKAGEAMKHRIEEVRAEGDSIGAVVECAIVGLPAGLGEHMYDGVENRLAAILFGIPGVKGVEFGLGFGSAALRGSENNDPFTVENGAIRTRTNHAGGILGGMTTGMPVIFRAAMKPTPSIFREQDSVDMVSMTPVKLSIKGRHDPCIALRAVPVFEAAAAIAICDLLADNAPLTSV